jgi:hypothetical protein
MASSPRTPQEGVAALRREGHRPATQTRPVPVGKELRAPLEGKAVALTRLAPRAGPREGPHMQPRVALTEGAEALQAQMMPHVPEHTLGLDVLPATEYLWDTATALLGETYPHRMPWVCTYVEPRLSGETAAVIAALAAEVHDPTGTATPRQVVRRTVGYDLRNRPYMRDDEDLARGWPMGTGVVEGACRHRVQARMEQSGRRGTKAGAQAVLDLRAVRRNGHWDTSWQFHQRQQHERLYGRSAPAPVWAEARALEGAA